MPKIVLFAVLTVADICEHKAPEGDLKYDIADYLQNEYFKRPI